MEDKIATFFRAESTKSFDQARISIAPPEKMRNHPNQGGWSYGEVKTPETINYRTFKPEKDGLFCEKIFGPTRDYECSCGKYKRIKNKGVICDRCGVEVTVSSVRRERMGHIELAVPVSHIWFLKSPPSRIGNILNLSIRNLERVIYYENYIVIDPGKTGLKIKQLLSEEEYQTALEKFGENTFVARMGAEGVKELLKAEDLTALSVELKTKLQNVGSKQTRIKLAKRLRIVEGFRSTLRGKNECRPEWMILNVIPVIPPDLRPLVPLEGGRFATSDLNDLYRRVINRNNRLKSILKLKTPEVIVRNEKRMLQEAVDALFDNGRQGRPVLGAGNRPLKSLSDNLRGKQGRFRQNLLGKRVDYSGRSVIVVGPELKLNQCGLPKEMALELFEPFIIHLLKERGYVHTIRSAKKMIERQTREVWDVLDEVTRDHPVMLNRAPTLHRLGIQAFDPILVEGKAIRLHPLVCTAFNADFDGDQMAVHVPLSREARKEARELMYAPRNIFSPASGEPIVNPTQDIALGCYYLTWQKPAASPARMVFSDRDEVLLALDEAAIELQQKIKLRVRLNPEDPEEQLIETTAGRVIFNQVIPPELGFINKLINKKEISRLIERCYKISGHERTVKLLDDLKDLGFESSTWSGASLGMKDMVIPAEKNKIIGEAFKEVNRVTKQHVNGSITERERYNKVIDIWTHASEDLSNRVFEGLRVQNKDKLNPLFMMVDSGARGSLSQVQQLAGMRGLMANPSGDIIEYPITANFREGLSVLEYFISTHGARKGLADTALKTADSGYLTRRLVDVAQDLITVEPDCGAIKGRVVRPLVTSEKTIIPLKERIAGRVALNDIKKPGSAKIIVAAGEEITPPLAEEIEKSGIQAVEIRSVLSCETPNGVCCKCYGRNLATQRMVEEGEAVGIIAAQSIGEPGTQLTMRTFHIGGTASLFARQPEIRAKTGGIVKYNASKTVKLGQGKFKVFNKEFIIGIYDGPKPEKSRELEKYKLEPGSVIYFADGAKVAPKDLLGTWDPYNTPILTENAGVVEYIDIIEGETMEMRKDKVTKTRERFIKSVFHQDFHPQIAIRDVKTGEVLDYYPISAGAIVEKKNGQKVKVGDRLGRTPRKTTKTKDITGGLPRVAELFEVRHPKDASEIARIGGIVEFGDRVRGKIKLIVRDPQTNNSVDHLIPQGKHLLVGKGDRVIKGQPLTEGPIVLQDLLEVCGMDALQDYLIDQVQEVYRLQGVKIDDKHIEIITRQMVGKVKIIEPGDTTFLYDEQVDRFKFQSENKRVMSQGGRPATSENLLLGITKASLSTESFISAASFQETTRVLADAAASSKVDRLKGFKENVIMGHLIPAGTAFPPLLAKKKEAEKEKRKEAKKSKEVKELVE